MRSPFGARLVIFIALSSALVALTTACQPACAPSPAPPECSVTTNPEACRKAYGNRCT